MNVHLIVEDSGKCSPAVRRFDFHHGSIAVGRASSNDWVLDDPEHVISKKHCEFRIDDAGLQITDQSSNGVYLNGSFSPLGRGNSQLLRNGDRLQIGEYVIRVEIEEPVDDDFLSAPFGQSGDDLTEVLAPTAEPGDTGLSDRRSRRPFGSPFEDTGSVPGPDPLGLDEAPSSAIPDEPASSDHLPLDAHFMPSPTFEQADREVPETLPQPDRGPPGDELLPEDWDLTGLLGPAKGADDEPAQVDVPSGGQATEPGKLFEDGTGEAPLSGRNAPAMPEEPAGVPARPEIAARPLLAGDAGGRREAGSLPGEVASGGLFQVFIENAGIGLDLEGLDAERVARKSGILFRKMLEGLMVLLQARMVVKSEYQLDRTLLRPVANNPLKSLPSVDEALGALYRADDKRGVWLDADAAVDEAVQDLKAHDLALVAGMNAVVDHFLTALAPERFEVSGGEGKKKLLSISALDKARGWDRFEAEYAALRRNVEEGLSGDARTAFERAYNREKQRLEG